MKYIFHILLFLFVLSGCAIGDNSSFSQKQQCAQHKDEMRQDSINIHTEWMNITGDPYDLNIEEIFYSKKYDSCLYILSIYKWIDIGEGDEKILLNKYLYDFFSKKELLNTKHADSKEYFDSNLVNYR